VQDRRFSCEMLFRRADVGGRGSPCPDRDVSVEGFAKGRGELRPVGLLRGVAFADVIMVEQRDIGAALSMEQIRGFLPFSRSWLKHRLGISEPKELMLIEADQDLAPEIRKMDLLLGGPFGRQQVAAG
jgi:hypothetical protein